MEEGKAAGLEFARELGCASAADPLGCLRKAPLARILGWHPDFKLSDLLGELGDQRLDFALGDRAAQCPQHRFAFGDGGVVFLGFAEFVQNQ